MICDEKKRSIVRGAMGHLSEGAAARISHYCEVLDVAVEQQPWER